MRINKWLTLPLIAILCLSFSSSVEARRRFGGFGSVRVGGYTRKSGVSVRPHTRSLPGYGRRTIAVPGGSAAASSGGGYGSTATPYSGGVQPADPYSSGLGESIDNSSSQSQSGPPPGYHIQKGAPSYVPNGYVYDFTSNSFKKARKPGVNAKSGRATSTANRGSVLSGQVLITARGNGSEGDVKTEAFRTASAQWSIAWEAQPYNGDGYLKVHIVNDAGRIMGPVVSVSGASKGRRKVNLRPGTYRLYIQANESWKVSAQRDSSPGSRRRR